MQSDIVELRMIHSTTRIFVVATAENESSFRTYHTSHPLPGHKYCSDGAHADLRRAEACEEAQQSEVILVDSARSPGPLLA